jgi:hypothetical protein
MAAIRKTVELCFSCPNVAKGALMRINRRIAVVGSGCLCLGLVIKALALSQRLSSSPPICNR